MQDLSYLEALGIGLAQALALFPGISRSGITISAGLFLGLERASAARFAFLMGTPVIAGAGLWKVRQLVGGGAGAFEPAVLIAGVVASAVSGLIAIWFLLRYLQNHNTDIFVVYRIGAAIVFAGLLLLR
jgi:undecaprenyl-diphosphatase